MADDGQRPAGLVSSRIARYTRQRSLIMNQAEDVNHYTQDLHEDCFRQTQRPDPQCFMPTYPHLRQCPAGASSQKTAFLTMLSEVTARNAQCKADHGSKDR